MAKALRKTRPSADVLDVALSRGLDILAETQHDTGSWKGDYGGPLFLLPMYVHALYITGRLPDEKAKQGFRSFLAYHQNEDGGWGLDFECESQVFTSALIYVALRMMGVGKDEPIARRCREWMATQGGAIGSASWGKLMLCVLGVYEYQGINPIPPELWLTPEVLPVHPSRMWCHARLVYLPMAHLYGRRARMPETPLHVELREELYVQPYETIDWAKARDRVAPCDAYAPRSLTLKATNVAMVELEKRRPTALREKALAELLDHIRAEDESTNYICLGPVNKVLNTLVWHFEKPGGVEVEKHLEKLPVYLQTGPHGLNMNGYNSSELWDTALAVQAIHHAGAEKQLSSTLEHAYEFIDKNQVLTNPKDHEKYYRHPTEGTWPFSTAEQGWPTADCTAEGLKASLLLAEVFPNAKRIDPSRLAMAVEAILSFQNDDGGWATYEKIRGPKWLESLNPSDVFGNIMIEYSYVECTAACIEALTAFMERYPQQGTRLNEAIARGRDFILSKQREDGSWEGSWGVCFTYGTWFAVTGLRCAGLPPDHPALQKAAAFLRTHQLPDGGWGETIESCRKRRYVHAESGQAVMTSWALLALAKTGEGDSMAVRRGVDFLIARQGADGRWPPEHIAGVFNKSCAIHYDTYLRTFPVWALAVCRGLLKHSA